MNTLLLKALIIDQDPKESANMSKLTKGLFSQTHLGRTAVDAKTDYQDTKPNVLLINLNMDQRTQNFEILESLNLNEGFKGVIMGFCDSAEPQLIAHAIEQGFQDVFVRPFDPDIIASKINKFLVSDKTQSKDIAHHQLRPALAASLFTELELLSVDENGMNFRSTNYLAKGTILKVHDEMLKSIFGKNEFELMVSRTWQGDDWNEHFLFAEPKQSSEETSASLRRFILGKI